MKHGTSEPRLEGGEMGASCDGEHGSPDSQKAGCPKDAGSRDASPLADRPSKRREQTLAKRPSNGAIGGVPNVNARLSGSIATAGKGQRHRSGNPTAGVEASQASSSTAEGRSNGDGIDGPSRATKGKQSPAGGAPSGQKRASTQSRAPSRVGRGAAPKKIAVGHVGKAKPNKRKSLGAACTEDSQAAAGAGKGGAANGEAGDESRTVPPTEKSCIGDVTREGPDATAPKESSQPGGTPFTDGFAPPPLKVKETRTPPVFSSDSEDEPGSDGHHSPKVVRATGHSSEEHGQHLSSIPRTASSKSQRGSKWTLGTPVADRNHPPTYTRRRNDRALTSMEQDAPPQATPLSPTVSDAFNAHFASREDQNWLLEEEKPHPGPDPGPMNWDFPFSCPRRNSNPTSEISGVSEYSGYEYSHRESDVRSRSGSLGLGRFDGHTFHALGSTGGHGMKYGSEAYGDSKSRDVGDIGGKGAMGGLQQKGALGVPCRNKKPGQSREWMMKLNAGNRGSDGKSQWVDNGGVGGFGAGSMPHGMAVRNELGDETGDRGHAHGVATADEDAPSEGHRHSSTFGERRRCLCSRVLQLAVVAAAGVAAVVYRGELLKAAKDDADDERRK